MKIKFKGNEILSTNAYYELHYFCLRYKEKLDQIRELESGGSRNPLLNATGRGKKGIFADVTADKAILLASLRDDVKLIEQTAMMIDAQSYQAILKSVTTGLTYEKIIANGGLILCGRRQFYDKRRLFFKLLYLRRNSPS